MDLRKGVQETAVVYSTAPLYKKMHKSPVFKQQMMLKVSK